MFHKIFWPVLFVIFWPIVQHDQLFVYITEYSDELQMKMRYPSSRCFVRAWGNSTDILLKTPIASHNSQSKSRVVCVASKCIPGFAFSGDKCFGLTKNVVSNGKDKNKARQACTNFESSSSFMEASGSGIILNCEKLI